MSTKNSFLWWLVGLVAMMIVAYVSESFWHGRFDFTQGKQYTLTPVTKEMVQEIDDQVSVRAVFSENLPAQFAQLKTHIQDMLVEIENASRGKISVRFEDPGQDSTKRAHAVRDGIQEIQVTEQERDGAVAKRGFFGMVISYGDKSEVVPLIQNLETFEYDMVVRLKKLTGGRKKIGVIEGTGPNQSFFVDPTGAGEYGEPRQGFAQAYPSLHAEMQVLYDVQVLDAHEPIPPDVAMILVSAPKDLSPAERYHIDQFLMSGRNGLFLAPAVQLNLANNLQAMPHSPAYLEDLRKYGLSVQSNMILDGRHGAAFFGGNDIFGTPYPYFPVIAEDDLNRDHVISSTIGSMILPWTQSVQADSANSISLLATTDQAWSASAPYNLIPQEQYMAVAKQKFDLAVLRTDTLYSAFDSVPEGVDTHGRPHLSKGTAPSNVLVIGNELFATDFFVRWSSQGMFGQNTVENLNFVLNACDFLALDEKLITIRSREVVRRPITDEGYKQRKGWIAFNLVAVPLLLALIGVVFLQKRKRSSRRGSK
ncbi:MAG: GldG family protein [Fibrobacter sp.]|nr:GldG family protein [Fibrobacter sp.]